ncbi:cytosol aminopeptidase [Thraustotheca clavata]|uniref:Cytosol aminopeptidase n=1 Tax=Thraustotheca clavata TaxID=74557 RepID=A0A1W0A405_9STRA|nr:cytosol aminopeptidase [Thraustotheca clavata]
MNKLSQKYLRQVQLLPSSVSVAANKAAQVIFVPKSSSAADVEKAVSFPVPKHALEDFQGDVKESLLLYPSTNDSPRTLLVGLGEKIDEISLRECTHEAIAFLSSKGLEKAYLKVPSIPSISGQRVTELIAQTSLLSNYRFDRHLSTKESDKLPLTEIFVQASEEFNKEVQEKLMVAEETILARNLGNERSDIVNPEFVEEIARASVDIPNLSVRVLQESELRAEGLNMMALVGQAATCPPRLVLVEYKGDPSNSTSSIALVGKVLLGITFDTGGLNLKPTGFIEDMHTDMCGAAAVLGAVRAAAKAKLPCNVVAVLALAENAIGSKAAKPHTIVKSYKGLTVEVNNTDAEGRLVLADALSYVQKKYSPHTVIDVATLTGACIVALGEYTAGLFSNSDQLATALQNAGLSTHERCWRMPILPEHTAELKGSVSDSRSMGKDRYGGACTAAAFLQQFIEKDVQWAHLDIAGPSNYSAPRSYMPKGATGYGVQVLYEYLKASSKA